jgi:hypothetical protein
MELSLFELIAVVVAGITTLAGVGSWLLKKGVDRIAGKVEDGAEKTALAVDGLAETAKAAGLQKVGVALEEFADVPDELGDVARVVEEMTKNQNFTKEKFLELFDEGKDVVVEAKDFIVKVVRKQ